MQNQDCGVLRFSGASAPSDTAFGLLAFFVTARIHCLVSFVSHAFSVPFPTHSLFHAAIPLELRVRFLDALAAHDLSHVDVCSTLKMSESVLHQWLDGTYPVSEKDADAR